MTDALRFPEQLDIRNVAEAARGLGPHTHFDASGVERCDSAGLQLLIAARQAWGGTWSLSKALIDQLTAQGIAVSFFLGGNS